MATRKVVSFFHLTRIICHLFLEASAHLTQFFFYALYQQLSAAVTCEVPFGICAACSVKPQPENSTGQAAALTIDTLWVTLYPESVAQPVLRPGAEREHSLERHRAGASACSGESSAVFSRLTSELSSASVRIAAHCFSSSGIAADILLHSLFI